MASLVEVKEDLVLVGGLTHSTLHNRQELIDEVTVCLPQSGSWIKLTNMQDGVFSASVVASGR